MAKYGVRWEARGTGGLYTVYEVATGEAVASYRYRKGENNRGKAHGTAVLHRENLNRKERGDHGKPGGRTTLLPVTYGGAQ